MRRLAGAGLDRRGYDGPGPPASPTDIYSAGSGLRVAWWSSASGIVLSGSDVTSWTDVWNSNVMTGDATPMIYSATTFPGTFPCVRNNSNAGSMRQITLNLAAGTRPYLFLVCSSVNSGGTNRPIVMLTNAGGTSTGASLEIRKNSAQTFMFRRESVASGEQVTTSAVFNNLTLAHMLELGFTAGGTAAAVNDNVNTNTALTGTPDAALTQIILSPTAGSGGLCRLADIVLLAGEPSLEQKRETRRYFKNRYPTIGTIT